MNRTLQELLNGPLPPGVDMDLVSISTMQRLTKMRADVQAGAPFDAAAYGRLCDLAASEAELRAIPRGNNPRPVAFAPLSLDGAAIRDRFREAVLRELKAWRPEEGRERIEELTGKLDDYDQLGDMIDFTLIDPDIRHALQEMVDESKDGKFPDYDAFSRLLLDAAAQSVIRSQPEIKALSLSIDDEVRRQLGISKEPWDRANQ